MADHNPPVRLGGAELQVVGVYATGDPDADNQALLPLSTAERLFGLAGQAHGLYVQVDAPANVERAAQEGAVNASPVAGWKALKM